MSGVTLRLATALLFASACASAQAADLKVSGSVRARYESLNGQYRPGLGGSDQMLSTRSSVAVEWRSQALTLGGEVIDSRGYLSDEGGSISTNDVNTLEPAQLYARLNAGTTEWTVGRFTQDLGSRRLVSRSRFGNTTNAFTGGRVVWKGEQGSSLTGLYVLPNIRHPTTQAAAIDNEQEVDGQSDTYQFYGAFYTTRPLAPGVRADTYAFRLTEEDEPDRTTKNRRMNVAGARVFRNPAPGKVDFEVEGVWESGTSHASTSARDLRDLDVAAGHLHAEAGWTFDRPWSPRLELAYDYGTGDKDPNDGEYNRFDTLYGSRRADFGPTSLDGALSRSNYSAPAVRLDLASPGHWDGGVSYRPLWLAQARDAFANTGVQDATGHSGRFAGHQIEGRWRRIIRPDLAWELGGAVLKAEGFLKHAPNATHDGATVYGYTDLTFTF